MDLTPQEKLLERIKCVKDPIYFLNTYGYVFNAVENKVTPMKCFDYQVKCVKDFHKYRNNIVLKSRQCLPENTFVDSPDGPKAIQDLKVGDFIYSYNLEENRVEMDTVSDAWCSGEKQCVKIKLKDTRNIELGENHPLWVVNKNDWIRAKDLEINDEILDANLGFGDVSADTDEVKLLAYLITDGCTNKQVKFTNNNLDYLNEFESSVNTLFSGLEIRKKSKDNGYDYFPHQVHGSNTLNSIMEWCEIKGIANKKTEFKNLPEEIFYWDKKSVALFINRVFAGDGWISIMKKKKSERLELGLGSPSVVFLEQIKALLKKFDIKGNIYEVKNMKLQQNRFYKLRITHSKSISKFISDISIYKKVTEEHLKITASRKHNVKDTSTVRKIEKTAVKTCYDISVTKNENFLVNGLLVHNTGLSVITAGYVAWRLMFRYEEKILIIANKGDGAIRFLDTVKQFIERTPEWLKPAPIAKNNQTELEFAKPHASWVKAKASSPEAGRGESLTMLVLDETAFIKDDEQIWMGAGMALSATRGKCIMISTPNGTGSLYHKTWVKAVKKDNDFNHMRVHWTENPQSSVGLVWKKDISTGEDIPWSPWYDEQCRRLGHDSVKIAQELDLSFEGSKYLAIESPLIDKYEKKIRNSKPTRFLKYDWLIKGQPDAGKFTNDESTFHVFKEPQPGASYLVSGDVARGDGKDYSTLQVIDVDTLEQVAEYRDKIGVDQFPYLIDWVGRRYNNAFVAIEANTFGLGVCYDLRDKFKYKRLFYSKNVQEMHVRPTDFRVPEGVDIPGFQSDKKTRPMWVKTIQEHMREGTVKINSLRLLAEMTTFIMNNGRPEAERGFNDDLIAAFGIALYVRDTEYSNVSLTSSMHKAMLDAFSFSSNNSATATSEVPQYLTPDKKPAEKKDVDLTHGGNSIFWGSGSDSSEADDDFSWMMK